MHIKSLISTLLAWVDARKRGFSPLPIPLGTSLPEGEAGGLQILALQAAHPPALALLSFFS